MWGYRLHVAASLLVAGLSYEPKIKASTFDKALVSLEPDGDDAESLRLVLTYDGRRVSPWHDLPFMPPTNGEISEPLLTFVCEIPLGTTAKMEIHKRCDRLLATSNSACSLEHNPIVQDRFKDGSLRHYKYGASIVNYGAISQTWEAPDIVDGDTGLGGDNDPIDVLQLNARPCPRGAVQRVCAYASRPAAPYPQARPRRLRPRRRWRD